MPDNETLANDLLYGAAAIGKYTGLPTRKIFYYVEKGDLPVTRLGNLIVASKSDLRKHFTQQKSETAS